MVFKNGFAKLAHDVLLMFTVSGSLNQSARPEPTQK
jgi:hypothetical protein